MTIERDRAWAQGQKFLQRGQADKAIAEFERVAAEDPADLRAPLKLGDLELQRGNVTAARHHFMRVADTYMQEGFWGKAIAVLRQIARQAHDDLEVQQLLAELYDKQGLGVEASRQYLHVCKLYAKSGHPAQAVEALERASEFDGGDADAAVEWAQQAAAVGESERALQKLAKMSDRLREDNLLEPWAKVAEQLLLLDPQLSGVACQLARYAMTAGRPAVALANLRVAFRAAPQDLDILQLLAEAFEALGEVDKALSVYAELAAQARRRGQQRMLERLLGHIVRLNPSAADARNELHRLADSGQSGLKVRRGVRKAEHQGDERPLQASDVAALLVEARVFHRYRLVLRAREYVAQILAAFPDHAEARELELAYSSEAADLRARRANLAPAPSAAPLPMAAEPTAQSAVERWRQTEVSQGRPEAEPAPQPVPTLLLSPAALAAERLKLAETHAEPPAAHSNRPAAAAHAEHVRVDKRAIGDVEGDAPLAVFDFDLSFSGGEAASPSPAASGPPRDAKALLTDSSAVDVDALDALIAAAGPAAEQAQADQTSALQRLDKQVGSALASIGASTEPDEDYVAALQLGATYQDMELFDEAMQQYDSVKSHPPLAAEAWRLTAACLLKKGEMEAAWSAFAAGLAEQATTARDKSALHRDFARALTGAGRQEEATRQRQLADRLSP